MENKKFAPRRDFQGLKDRRLRAGKMFASGEPQAEVVHRLKVSRTTASRWYKDWKIKGQSGLKGAGRAGRKPKLTKSDLNKIDKALRKGPLENGFSTNLWTLPKIATVIKKITGISYHPGHVWKILPLLGWSLQKPIRKAKESNDEAIEAWKTKGWARIKKKPKK